MKCDYVGISYDTMDCWALAAHFYKNEYDITLPNYELSYEDKHTTDVHKIHSVVDAEKSRAWKQVFDYQYGDLIVFAQGRRQHHIGVYVGNQQVLHSSSTTVSSVIQRLSTIRATSHTIWRYNYGSDKNLSKST